MAALSDKHNIQRAVIEFLFCEGGSVVNLHLSLVNVYGNVLLGAVQYRDDSADVMIIL